MTEETIEWPIDEGIWMAYFNAVKVWIPIKTMMMKDDCPSLETLKFEEANPEAPKVRKDLLMLAQNPQEGDSWPYMFQGNHPSSKWRKPDEEEMKKAKIFYGIS